MWGTVDDSNSLRNSLTPGGPRCQLYTAMMTMTKIVQHSAAATLAMPNPRSLLAHTVTACQLMTAYQGIPFRHPLAGTLR